MGYLPGVKEVVRIMTITISTVDDACAILTTLLTCVDDHSSSVKFISHHKWDHYECTHGK